MKILSRGVDIKVIIAVFIMLLILPQALLAEEDASSDFESCILQEHGDLKKTPETAFQVGTCFYEIVHDRCKHDGDDESGNKPLLSLSSVSSHIILQYADSWFVLAAKDGHQAAMEQLAKTRVKLNAVMR